jgi:YjzC-like protein
MAKSGDRFRTSQICPTSGTYDFDGYEDSTPRKQPTANEKSIPMKAGGPFPPIHSTNASCWWKFR